MKIYDYIIVGSGPAGMFAVYEIIKLNKKAKICLIEMGKPIEKRKKSEVMFGFGGAGTYSDGKLHYTPTLSHRKALHLINEHDYQKIIDYVDSIYTEFGVNGGIFSKRNCQSSSPCR